MDTIALSWQILPPPDPPDEFVQMVADISGEPNRYFTTALLWQRGLHTGTEIAAFLDPNQYTPSPPEAFGIEMQLAVERLQQADKKQEKVLIWGDFDADGLTATAVLWEGLGRIFPPSNRLGYFVPNRLTESHGLSVRGLDQAKADGYQLIVTCDTGCSQTRELAYARSLGLDVIVTDHHTLPVIQPPAVAVINPRQLPRSHPLANLSGVAVAYKLLEALYPALNLPLADLESLLDLVAIGLIADLVELTGECRYLAQRGLQRLNPNNQANFRRPGLIALLENCKRNGDRPTDISFGLAPRINAVSRIHGDAHFVIDLLTSQDPTLAQKLANEAELANTRRKGLQQQVLQDIKTQLSQFDLSSQHMIVLHDPQWPVGILGLVAGQVAQEYHRPTLLLTSAQSDDEPIELTPAHLARGSARSVAGLDLYQLIESQQHLLAGFGGHPLALGLSLPIHNIPLLREALNRQLRTLSVLRQAATLTGDLTITVADLLQDDGKALFRQLRSLEPFGMGNPVPRLYLSSCEFRQIKEYGQLEDLRKQTTRFVRTEFELWDASAPAGFAGIWWGHPKTDLPPGPCDVLVELDFQPNSSGVGKKGKPRYQVRIVAVRSQEQSPLPVVESEPSPPIHPLPTLSKSPLDLWQTWLGLAKYLSRTQDVIGCDRLMEVLGVSDRTVSVGIQCLEQLGFEIIQSPDVRSPLQIHAIPNHWDASIMQAAAQPFLKAVKEEQFRQHYQAQTTTNRDNP